MYIWNTHKARGEMPLTFAFMVGVTGFEPVAPSV